jgi:hypothetical protein
VKPRRDYALLTQIEDSKSKYFNRDEGRETLLGFYRPDAPLTHNVKHYKTGAVY